MSRLIRDVSYFLLIIVDSLLAVIFYALKTFVNIVKTVSNIIINVNMTKSSKKRKIVHNPDSNPISFKRGAIDENWQKLLSSTLFMEQKNEKTESKDKKHYTGSFRRSRKEKNKTETEAVENNLGTLNISEQTSEKQKELDKNKNNNENRNKLTKFLAMDCEMVGVGYEGNDHMIARVSIVNKFGDCIYDKFVKAREEVVDYRTKVSGIRKEDLLNGEEFTVVQKEVSELIKGKILVGHSLKNDLSVLYLSHPKRNIRDTSRYKPFRKITKGSTPSLKRLAKEILGIDIQDGEHSSVEDARAAMQIYCTVQKTWEQALSEKRGYSKKFVEA
ncbi:unnamed protein product [Danaus chrysippus]|uniref:RNA exonuclease 4 n=1 Tax=Danaus chrysippus TaxID=151541 RepID=A0A8J2W8V8_9NEOP|nr:unnamed protein product [Danaus chrysippus]